MRRRILLAVAAASLVALATVSLLVVSASSAPGALESDGSVPITLSEWEIGVPDRSIPAGRVVFEEQNDGRLDHDLLLVRTGRDPADLPRGLSGPVPSAAGEVVFGEIHAHSHDDGEKEGHLRPGASRRRAVDLDPGTYVLICPVPGHYAAGQSARLVVE